MSKRGKIDPHENITRATTKFGRKISDGFQAIL